MRKKVNSEQKIQTEVGVMKQIDGHKWSCGFIKCNAADCEADKWFKW